MHPRPARLLAPALCLLAGAAPAADLKLDGRVIVHKLMGDSVQITVTGVTGTAGLPVLLFLDVSPGPIPSPFGGTLPLGFTPALSIFNLGSTGAGGTLTTTITVPQDPAAHGLTLHFMAVVVDPGVPNNLDISGGARMTILDRNIELAGNGLGQYPFFDHVLAINQGSSVELGIDPTRYPGIVGQTADVYVVASKTRSQWIADASLVDVAGGPQTFTFGGSTIQANTITLDTGNLSGPDASPASGDVRIGVPYDVVIDFGQNGRFDPRSDLIDGYHASHAGFYVVRDTSAGATAVNPSDGPYPVSQLLYTGGVFLSQATFYPTAIASMGRLPLIVVSHGNGHDFQWYDHIGYRLASYGYVVMSHQNNTGPGSGTAAMSTIANTEFLLTHQGAIGGGVLNGHIDNTTIVWIGHSRGADGVARAYDDLFTGAVTPVNFSIDAIKLVDSIAPVDFGGFLAKSPVLAGTSASNPHDATFHLWVAQADADVTGCAASNTGQWYHLHERATHIRQSTSLLGVGHGDYHNGSGPSVAAGPELIGRPDTHLIFLGQLLPLIKHYVEGSVPARDFLWRQYESFRPVGVPFVTGLEANLMFQDEAASGKYIIDDFQDILGPVPTPTPTVASSGAPVTRTTPQYTEGSLDDNDAVFTHTPSDIFNGFTMDAQGGTGPFRSESFGCVFSVAGGNDSDITYDVGGTQPNFSDYVYLSFRAAQGTRHPLTTALLGDLTFTVTLEDSAGVRSSINIGAYGGGIEEPYQRTTCSRFGAKPPDVGWNSEFETIRIRLTDFQNNGTGLNLTEVSKLIFNFGPSWGSPQGRLGLDEIELTGK